MRTIGYAAIISTAALMVATTSPRAKLYDVSGTAQNVTGIVGLLPPETLGTCASGDFCKYFGRVTIDMTNGTIPGVSITFPGLATFNTVLRSGFVGHFFLSAKNRFDQDLFLAVFPEPGTGFTEGLEIDGLQVYGRGGPFYLGGVGGLAPTVPEPSTWAMMLLGFAGLGFAGYRARMRVKAA
jgi:hypothetical protein